MGFPSGSEVPLNTHSQSDTQARTNTKPTHRSNHSTVRRPSMYLPVRHSLAAFSLSQPQICSNYSPIFAFPLVSVLPLLLLTQHFPVRWLWQGLVA